MFLVSDTLQDRQAKVRRFLTDEPAIAVLLAAADFEWTIRRAILLLGVDPNLDIREADLHKASGLGKYERAWATQVVPQHHKPLRDVVPDWKYLEDQAMPLRHKLIHGEQGTTSGTYAQDRVEAILAATNSIVEFAAEAYKDVFARLEIRPRKKGTE
jgi:hypothetical protein